MRTAILLWTLSCSATWGASALAQPPNLIFILTDDQGIESIQGPHWPNEMGAVTPNLDRYAQLGVSFTSCRVNPNCSPTRGALMTGRDALTTGLIGVIGRPVNYQIQADLSLQGHERTIAEVLHDAGYYTVLIDKWHCGYWSGQYPKDQGFEVFDDWWDYIIPSCANRDTCEPPPGPGCEYDCDDLTGDERLVSARKMAVSAVANREPEQPYALFFHTITPHQRERDAGGYLWWEVAPTLAPETYVPNNLLDPPNAGGNTTRFIMNVEALDTVIGQLLGPAPVGLGVMTDVRLGDYVEESETIVFYIGDNGTDFRVSSHGLDRAKNSPYEGGSRVPLFVFGEGVPSNAQGPIADSRQVTHVDLYETIADVIGDDQGLRRNPIGAFPRRSVSFANAIGYGDPVLPRAVTLTSYHDVRVNHNVNPSEQQQIWMVSLTDGRYKLICRSGGPNLADPIPDCDPLLDFTYCVPDEFYDLELDPQEQNNLLSNATLGINEAELEAYINLRDELVNHWYSAVSENINPDELQRYAASFTGGPGGNYRLVFHIERGVIQDLKEDEFWDDRHPDRGELLGGQDRLSAASCTQEEYELYLAMRRHIEEAHAAGDDFIDVKFLDIPVTDTLVLTEGTARLGPLTVGHEVNGDHSSETRTYLRFGDLDQISLPDGYTIGDIDSAQLVLRLESDSDAIDETDTGVIRARRVEVDWVGHPENQSQLWESGWNPDLRLGAVDLPPHIIADASTESVIENAEGGVMPEPDGSRRALRVLPLPSKTPISFAHSNDLLDVVRHWYLNPDENYGLSLMADRLDTLPGDQRVHFLGAGAFIRLTLRR